MDKDSVAEEIEQADAFKGDIYTIVVKIEIHSPTCACMYMYISIASISPSNPKFVAGLDPPSQVGKVKWPKLTFQRYLTTWTMFYKAAIHDITSLSRMSLLLMLCPVSP